MTNLGNTATPAGGYFFDDTGNSQFWSGAFTMPAGGGTVTDLYVYVAGDGASVTGRLVIWGSSSIIWQSGNITFPSGSQTNGGQGWQHVSVPNIYVAAGTLNFGFWSSGHVVWTGEGSGSTNYQRTASVATLASAGTEGTGGALGAYITYIPGGIAEINTGTPAAPAWTQGVAYVYDGTAWQPCSGVEANTGTPAAPNWVNGA